MTARTRTATPATTPAKKTTARKTTAKKTTPRTPRQKPPAVVSLTKPPKPLPTRTRPFMTDVQGYATLAARIAGILTPRITAWIDHGDGTATRALRDGTLHYTQNTRTLTWQATCLMGAVHTYELASPSTAVAARVLAARCHEKHHDLTSVPALGADELAELGILDTSTWARHDLLGEEITKTIPIPIALADPDPEPRTLADQLTRSQTGAADTQPLSRDEIAAGLTARADTETPKEHPQP